MTASRTTLQTRRRFISASYLAQTGEFKRMSVGARVCPVAVDVVHVRRTSFRKREVGVVQFARGRVETRKLHTNMRTAEWLIIHIQAGRKAEHVVGRHNYYYDASGTVCRATYQSTRVSYRSATATRVTGDNADSIRYDDHVFVGW